MPDSKIEDLSVLGPLLPPKTPFAILTGSPAAIRAHMDFKGQDAKGELVVEGGRVGVGLGDQSLRGEFSAIVKVREGDLQSRTFDIADTSVSVKNGVFSDPGSPPLGQLWSGEAHVSEGSVRTTVPGNLNVKVKLKLTDTRPVVAVFAASCKSVRRFKGLLDVKDVTGSAELAVEGKTMVIEGVDVQGRGLQMLGRMRLKDGRQNGAFCAKLRQLSAAVGIENGKRDW